MLALPLELTGVSVCGRETERHREDVIFYFFCTFENCVRL